MLVAVLSSLEPAGDGATCPRAFLTVAGRTVIERQAEAALALGCERVICLASGIAPEILAAQRVTERAGRSFHAVRHVDALRAQVVAADELVIIADGILPDRDVLADVIGNQRGVAAFPAELGVAHGFERINRDLAWAGAVRCRGAEMERLADLPGDIEPLSALMRAALQSGSHVQRLSEDLLADGRWPLIDNASKARTAGRRSVERRFVAATWAAPCNALVDRLIRARADHLLSAKRSDAAMMAAGVLAPLVAIISAGAGYLAAGLALMTICAALVRGWTRLNLLRDAAPGQSASAALIAFDSALVVTVVAHFGLSSWPTTLFPVLVMIGLARLAASISTDRIRAASGDRVALCAVLAFAAWHGVLGSAAQAIALLLLAACLFAAKSLRLTRA